MGQDDTLAVGSAAFVCVVQVALAVAGIFGHSVILYATYKTKEIQTKYGLLLVQLSVTHIICILGQLTNTAFIVATPVLNNMVCFGIFSVFITMMMWQSLIVLVISIDLLCAILIPLLYRKWSTRVCVVVNVVVCCLFSTAHSLVVYGATDSSKESECNLFNAHADTNSLRIEAVSYCIAALQVLIYLICYVTIYLRARNFMRKNKNACFRNQHRKTMRTISVLIIVYVSTWILSIILTHVITYVLDATWRRLLWMIASVLQMACFAQTFYVCYRRSSEYRNIFRRLFKSTNFLQKIKTYRKHACHPQTTHPTEIRTVSVKAIDNNAFVPVKTVIEAGHCGHSPTII